MEYTPLDFVWITLHNPCTKVVRDLGRARVAWSDNPADQAIFQIETASGKVGKFVRILTLKDDQTRKGDTESLTQLNRELA